MAAGDRGYQVVSLTEELHQGRLRYTELMDQEIGPQVFPFERVSVLITERDFASFHASIKWMQDMSGMLEQSLFICTCKRSKY